MLCPYDEQRELSFFSVWLVFGLHHAHHRAFKDEGLNFLIEGEKAKLINLSTLSYLFWIACFPILN